MKITSMRELQVELQVELNLRMVKITILLSSSQTQEQQPWGRASPFDLNGDGRFGLTLSGANPKGDINSVGSPVAGCGPLSPEVENSYNDWDAINLVFLPDQDSVDGVTKAISDPYTGTIEVTPATGKAISAKAHALDIQFIPPPSTDWDLHLQRRGNSPIEIQTHRPKWEPHKECRSNPRSPDDSYKSKFTTDNIKNTAIRVQPCTKYLPD